MLRINLITILFFTTVAFAESANSTAVIKKNPTVEIVQPELNLLSPSEFQNLYTDDQTQYIKLLQKIAIQISFETDYLATSKWPSIFNLLINLQPETAEAAGGLFTVSQLRTAIINLNAETVGYNQKRPPARTALGVVTDTLPFINSDAMGINEVKYSVDLRRFKRAFERRNLFIRELSAMAPEVQEELLPHLEAGIPLFDRLKDNTRNIWRSSKTHDEVSELNHRFLLRYQEVQKSVAALNLARRQQLARVTLITPQQASLYRPLRQAPAAPAARAAASRTRSATSRTHATTSPGQCVRCIYGGFVIVNQTTCSGVHSLRDSNHDLHALQTSPGQTLGALSCDNAAEPILCNPLLFGLKNGEALCVQKTQSATRSCMSASDKSSAAQNNLRQMIAANPAALHRMQSEISSICDHHRNCVSNLSSGKREDIRLTCAAVRQQIASFRESMRSVSNTDPPVGPSSPNHSTSGEESQPASGQN